jgi:hypothetical protein
MPKLASLPDTAKGTELSTDNPFASVEIDDVDVEIFSVLCDFFEREVWQNGRLDLEDGLMHTSHEARRNALHLLLCLTGESLVITSDYDWTDE